MANQNQNKSGSTSSKDSPKSGRSPTSMDDDKQKKTAHKGGETINHDRDQMSGMDRKGGNAKQAGNRSDNDQSGNQGGRKS